MLVDKSRTDSVRLLFTIRRDVSLKIRNYELPMLPSFTISVWPVMKDAIGEARKSAAGNILGFSSPPEWAGCGVLILAGDSRLKLARLSV